MAYDQPIRANLEALGFTITEEIGPGDIITVRARRNEHLFIATTENRTVSYLNIARMAEEAGIKPPPEADTDATS